MSIKINRLEAENAKRIKERMVIAAGIGALVFGLLLAIKREDTWNE